MANIVYFIITHADDTVTVGFVDTDYPPKLDTRTGQMLHFTPEDMVKDKELAYAADPLMSSKLPFKSWRIIDKADIPTDRGYRNAWRDNSNGINHDMSHAREIHKDKLRREREPRLAALDVEYQRADETGDNQKKQQVAAQKQALRDITKDPRLAAAETIDQLKLVVI